MKRRTTLSTEQLKVGFWKNIDCLKIALLKSICSQKPQNAEQKIKAKVSTPKE